MEKVVFTYAMAEYKSLRKEDRDSNGNVVGIENEGQSCIVLSPSWKDWGRSIIIDDNKSVKLRAGKRYRISILIDDKEDDLE